MTLRERQSLFAKLTADLIQYTYRELGYELTFGETVRENAASYSLHPDRLAIDLNLFIDGKYCTDSESHRPLGEYWKKLHPDCAWGGDFRPKQDGNHYSLAYNGRK